MKRSLLITLEFPPDVGGVSKYYKNICAQLPSDSVTVLAMPRPDAKESDKKREYKIIRRPLLRRLLWPRWWPMIGVIRRAALREKVEVLQVGQVLPVGTAVYLLTRIYRRWKYIVYTHGMDVTVPQKYFFKKWLMRRILRQALQVITISQFTKNQLLSLGISNSKITMVSPGVKVFDIHEDTKAMVAETMKKYDLVGKRVLLTVGRLVARKGHELVIRALPKVISRFPNLLYVIVGDGPMSVSLKLLVEKLKLDQHVLFVGQVTDKQKIVWYELAELFIMTSRQLENNDVEGFGIVYLEANALAKPVIASRSGGIPEAVVDGETGVMVDSDNIEQIETAIVKLFGDHELAKKLGEQGQRRAQECYTWEAQVQKLKAILE